MHILIIETADIVAEPIITIVIKYEWRRQTTTIGMCTASTAWIRADIVTWLAISVEHSWCCIRPSWVTYYCYIIL